MIAKRAITLSVLSLTLLSALPQSVAAQYASFRGCFLAADSGSVPVSAQNVPKIAATNFPQYDYQLNGIATNAATFFQLFPDFGFYQDNSPNAFATPRRTAGSQYPDGSVRIGVRLIDGANQNLQQNGYAYSYVPAAVIAHEFGHVMQYKRGLPRGKYAELQADFLAGWYFSYLGSVDQNYAPNQGRMQGLRQFYSIGDFAFNDQDHHGTPEERMRAFQAGLGMTGANPDQAWNRSRQYLASIGYQQ